MPWAICRMAGQAWVTKPDGKKIIRTFAEGETWNFTDEEAQSKDFPWIFELAEKVEGVDFKNASREELLLLKWSLSSAKEFMIDAYGLELRTFEGATKEDYVNQIIDARGRN